MSSPLRYVERLANLAESARHHPEPAVAVSLLAQLLLDVVTATQPLVEKYALILKASGTSALFEQIERDLQAAEAEMAATALPGAQPGTYDPAQDTTGTGA